MANSTKNKRSYKVGDKVRIKCHRSAGGCCVPSEDCTELYATAPIEECVIDRAGIGSVAEVFSLVWADTGEPVGLPFFEFNFLPE